MLLIRNNIWNLQLNLMLEIQYNEKIKQLNTVNIQ